MSEVSNYRERFLKEGAFQVIVEGKIIRISPRVHSAIRKIVMVSENPNINISTYVDNVLREHLREQGAAIADYLDSAYRQVVKIYEKP